MRLVRCGDEAAFEAIYDRHHRGILAFCRHMLGSREEGEDAVQHTFAAAYRDLVDTDKPIQLKAWLYTIARNRSLSLLRARREQVSIDDAEPSTDGLAAEVQRREDLRDMLGDLQRLPEDQRAALVLSELGALSHEEVAMSLGVRKDKVKALVFQARESLSTSRKARETDCREIQEQLSVLRGGALRRTEIRRHVEQCAACTDFKAEVQRQRASMAVLLPVAPTVGLREAVLGTILGGGGMVAGGGLLTGGAGGLLAATGAKGLAAKVLTIAAVAGGATGGGLMAIDQLSDAQSDTSRDPLAMAPPEEGAVRLVSDLRSRADQAAQQRTADFKAAAQATPAATASAGTRGDGKSRRRGGANEPRRDGAGSRQRSTGTKRRDRSRGAAGGSPAPVAPTTSAPAGTPASPAGPKQNRSGRGNPASPGPQPKSTPPGQVKREASGKPTPPGQIKRQNAGNSRGPSVTLPKVPKPPKAPKPPKVTLPTLPPQAKGNGPGNGNGPKGPDAVKDVKGALPGKNQ